MTVANYFLPGSLPEALDLLMANGPELLVMAGGTVAMPLINEGISQPRLVMGLRKAGLDRLERQADELRIGATVTLSQLLEQQDVPLLRRAAGRTASWSIRNMGTIGGNLFTPPPGGDIAVALLALDARVILAGPGGERSVPLAAFYTGFMTQDLASDELVTAIAVPLRTSETVFLKFGRKAANTPAVVTVAVSLGRANGAVTVARIALGAVGPHPIRARGAEAALLGQELQPEAIARAAAAAAGECQPFDDGVASSWYRERMVRVMVGRALEQLANATGKEDR